MLAEILLDASGGLDKMNKHQMDIYDSVKVRACARERARFVHACVCVHAYVRACAFVME